MKTEAKIEFIQYGTRSRGDKSGAYLFLPGIQTFSFSYNSKFFQTKTKIKKCITSDLFPRWAWKSSWHCSTSCQGDWGETQITSWGDHTSLIGLPEYILWIIYKNVFRYWWFSMTIASYRCCAKMIPIPIHILARGIIQTMPTWKCLGFFFAKYPPKSPRIQRLKFVCTCPTTCPSRTTRTLNSACWRRTINIQGVFIQGKNIK